VTRSENPTFGNFEKNEDFNSEQFNPEWITLRAPATDWYSLTDNPGFLSLQCAEVTASEKKTPAFIARRLQHHLFECTTKLFFNPADEKDAAGILIYKDESHQYFLSVRQDGKGRKISLEKIGKSDTDIQASRKITNSEAPVQLKVISTGLTFEFYYADQKDEWKIVCKEVDAEYLSTKNTGGFTGTVIGMYATKK
jgi:alpha-N-arabinofuranosidase